MLKIHITPVGDRWELGRIEVVDAVAFEGEAYHLGTDPLPDDVPDIRGKIYGEQGEIYAVKNQNDVKYYAVV